MQNYLLQVDIGFNTYVKIVIKADSAKAATDEIKNISFDKLVELWHRQHRPLVVQVEQTKETYCNFYQTKEPDFNH